MESVTERVSKPRTRSSQEELEMKYLSALKKAKDVLDETSVASMTNIAKKHGVSSAMGKVLQEGGILEKMEGKANDYKWVGKSPDIAMAKETRRRVVAYINRSIRNEAPKKKARRKPVKFPKMYLEVFGIKLKFVCLTPIN